MKPPVLETRAQLFSHLLQKLLLAVQHLEQHLMTLQIKKDLLSDQSSLEKTAITGVEIATIVAQLATIQTFTFFEDEVFSFYDLMICGNEMAQYLTSNQNTSKTMRRHAEHWQHLVKEFKTFLQTRA